MKTFAPHENEASALAAIISEIEECRGKPPYDYQRIIVCLTKSRDLARKLARRSGAALIGPARPVSSKCATPVIVVDRAGECSLETLESFVFFVNRTRGVVVLLVTGRGLVRWHERWGDVAAQLRRRTHLTIEYDD